MTSSARTIVDWACETASSVWPRTTCRGPAGAPAIRISVRRSSPSPGRSRRRTRRAAPGVASLRDHGPVRLHRPREEDGAEWTVSRWRLELATAGERLAGNVREGVGQAPVRPGRSGPASRSRPPRGQPGGRRIATSPVAASATRIDARRSSCGRLALTSIPAGSRSPGWSPLAPLRGEAWRGGGSSGRRWRSTRADPSRPPRRAPRSPLRSTTAGGPAEQQLQDQGTRSGSGPAASPATVTAWVTGSQRQVSHLQHGSAHAARRRWRARTRARSSPKSNGLTR